MNDYKKGVCLSVFVFILMNRFLSIESFINFTIFRLILILLTAIWIFKGPRDIKFSSIPVFKPIAFFLIVNLISVCISRDIVFSIKTYLSVTFECILFYLIMITSLNDKDDVLMILSYSCYSLLIVATIAIIEKYSGINLADYLTPSRIRPRAGIGDVISTFPHRILLGTAMAMGFPVALALIGSFKNKPVKKSLFFICVILFLSSCYFASSRGPWIGVLIGGVLMFSLGTKQIKKKLLVVIILVCSIFIIKPGVKESILGKVNATLDTNSFKAGTYKYRWELWRVAYVEIKKSPIRFLFGYGPGSSEALHWEGELSYEDRFYNFESWDNHFAADLLETGFIGLFSLILLYISILKKLYAILLSTEDDKNIIAAIISSVIILIFMKTNVKIFAPQLNFYFWTLVSAGYILGKSEAKIYDSVRST